jgi:hypothetical protein
LATPPKLYFSSILETKHHRSLQGTHFFIKTKNATVYSFKIFLNGKGRILLSAVTILPCPFRIFNYSLKMFLKSTFILVQKKTLQSKLKSFGGESRIRTCEVYTADLQSALVGRLSISPRLNK